MSTSTILQPMRHCLNICVETPHPKVLWGKIRSNLFDNPLPRQTNLVTPLTHQWTRGGAVPTKSTHRFAFPLINEAVPGVGFIKKIPGWKMCSHVIPCSLRSLYKLFDSWRLIAEVVVNRRQDVILCGSDQHNPLEQGGSRQLVD